MLKLGEGSACYYKVSKHTSYLLSKMLKIRMCTCFVWVWNVIS